ncbi:MAG: T9SS type A sorting domain-containing protein [Chitinophagaceae bacterium]|nr:T9SS type A sorting domain-containing protein [Chitinophagaceae bacterium]
MPQGNGQNINIRNNIIQGFGAYPVRGSNPTNITGCFVTHNDFYLNGNNNAVSWPGGNPANYTYNNNISQNPLFVSATNFSLQATSPCIDAGVNVGIPYNGSAPDMGYVEYGATGNIPPTANAGPDQTITLPTNTVSLTGTGIDPDGNITAYLWTKIAGPAAGTITNPNNAATTVTGLVQGVYRFELRVTDNNNAYGRDTVQITVNAASNIPPTANAGPDQTITLPTNTVSLSGSGNDPDGNITAYLWTKIAGPTAGTITNPNNAATTVTGLVQGVYRFELRVTDNNNAFGRDTVQITVNAASNIPPTANAGPDQTIILPTNVVIVSGSGTDPDGFITAYLWTKISGPANGTITNPNVAATSITGLVQGVYRFELRVTDNNGAFGRDTMQVTVNAGATNTPPSANAGPDQTITLPTNTVILSGSGIDPDGFITAYLWTKVAGPAAGTITNPNSAATSVTGLVQGVYQFELRVTDNNNAFGRDTVQITVNAASNIPPTANAGPDQTITLPTNTVSLSGSGNDPDGNITAYIWTKIAGPTAGTITNPNNAATTVTGLVQGVYRFELRVTDNNNAFGRDTVQITVNAASNIPPTANAGADQTIILPTNTVSLSGTGIDPDGFITAYLWTKVSGPANGTITNPNSAATTVTGLVQGVYRFELRITDNNGAFGRDTVQVTVIPGATNTPPSANAGTDQSITLPVNSVIISGSGIDPDGIITAYLWTKVAGPAAGTITNPNSAATSVTGLLQGVYRFELRVTDNSGAFGRDTVQVTVNTASNIAPTANAGPDQNITLPANSVSLTGAGTDPDGNITAWLWTKVAGPAAGTITNTNTAATAVTGLVEGFYQFELRVTDNNNAVGRDTIRVTVYPVPNNPPTANAGPNLTITLPDNTATLTGTGTDTDGSIVAYNWRQVTGPSGNVLFSTNTAITFLTNLVEGTYEFELTVTDNRGATASDLVIVVVIGTSGNQLQYNDINVYPNPVADIATLEIKASVLNSKQTVTITDMHGKIVFRKDLSYAQQNFTEKIDMRNLIKGTYIITVFFENGEKKNMKIVKM